VEHNEVMKLADAEKAMLDGAQGPARRKAMELLVRYGEALGAERFVETRNVAGVPGSSSLFLHNYYKERGHTSYDALFSLYDLDSNEVVPIPRDLAGAWHLQGGMDPQLWQIQGLSRPALEHQQTDEREVEGHGIRALKTCTPYLAGNVPAQGEHCAWMESSAVVFCNSVLGARTNTEGRESTSAAMLTGRIPDWGFHRDDFRYGTHLIQVEVPVESVMDWGLLGYFIGGVVEENIPVVTGVLGLPDWTRHKHFGAAAASSGGVEMYHLAGITPEAATCEMAFGPRKPGATFRYGPAERKQTYEALNSTAQSTEVDYVMLGCPHAALEQLSEAATLLAGRKIRTHLWIFTSRAAKAEAEAKGYVKAIQDAGGWVMTDTCSAIGRILPPGTKVVALDSAKQTHYLPAIMGVEAWFGSTADCIRAAITGRWSGGL
jgi:predicted aconitase